LDVNNDSLYQFLRVGNLIFIFVTSLRSAFSQKHLITCTLQKKVKVSLKQYYMFRHVTLFYRWHSFPHLPTVTKLALPDIDVQGSK